MTLFFFSPSKLEGNNGTPAGICCSDSEVSRPSSQVARSIRNWVPDIYVMCSSNQRLDNLGYSNMTLNVHRVCHLPNTKTSQGVWHWMTGSDLSLFHRWEEQLHSLKMEMLCMSTYTQHIGKWCHCLLNIMIDCSVLNILQQLKAVQLKIPP